jgi:hypothetical protein
VPDLGAWLAGEAVVGIIFLFALVLRRRLHLWPVVAAFLVGDLLRALGGIWRDPISLASIDTGFSGDLPALAGFCLRLIYASFAFIPLVILAFSKKEAAMSAGLTVLLDGLVHLLLPVKPPWMVGSAIRWPSDSSMANTVSSLDVNPFAAFPSLHVALPASQGWRIYTIAISLSCFALGEHWVTDIVGGLVLAYAARKAVERGWLYKIGSAIGHIMRGPFSMRTLGSVRE